MRLPAQHSPAAAARISSMHRHACLLAVVAYAMCLSFAGATISHSPHMHTVTRGNNAELNPGCGARCDNLAGCVVVVNSTHTNPYTNDTDVLTYIWSVIGAPIVHEDFYASADAVLVDIDWDALLAGGDARYGSITRGPADMSASIVFNSVIEFSDEDDSAQYSPATSGNTLLATSSLAARQWNCTLSVSPSGVSPVLVATTSDGNFTLTLSIPEASRRSSNPPRRLLQINSTLITVETKSFTDGDKAKVAVNLTLIGANVPGILADVSAAIDDEYTPSIFQNVKVTLPHAPGAPSGIQNAYAQWKPCAYTSPSRKSADIIPAEFVESDFATAPSLSITADGGGSVWGQGVYGRVMILAFGAPEDKAYSPDYLVWELSLGYGFTAKDELSALVIAIIACCVGIPFVVITVGLAYSFVKSRLGRTHSYTPIQ